MNKVHSGSNPNKDKFKKYYTCSISDAFFTQIMFFMGGGSFTFI